MCIRDRVVAILSILLCIAVPNMMNYINAAHEATAQTEARICVDAVSYTHLDVYKRQVLEDAGSFYEKEAARAVNQMIALLEPAMILILALVVGSVVMAIMMPVFNMYSSML